MKKITHIVGARPNFMKVAPVMAALSATGSCAQQLVHTGQHYDENMSRIFFRDLGLPEPDINLEVGSASHAVQTAEIMTGVERLMTESPADLVLVYGDVNSTVAAALACTKLGIGVGHVEAGLRSFDRTMPEEINRVVTDHIADLLFTPSADGDENLAREGIAREKVHRVGNVMIDTLVRLLPAARARRAALEALAGKEKYALVTLHRPSNVDEEARLRELLAALNAIASDVPVIFPVHPRTRQRLANLGAAPHAQLRLVDPLGYLDFVALQETATVVITDSGGIQEETTYLGVPCLTLRSNTERPITVTMGTNAVIGDDIAGLLERVQAVLAGEGKRGSIPPLWDGKAGERIAAIVR